MASGTASATEPMPHKRPVESVTRAPSLARERTGNTDVEDELHPAVRGPETRTCGAWTDAAMAPELRFAAWSTSIDVELGRTSGPNGASPTDPIGSGGSCWSR